MSYVIELFTSSGLKVAQLSESECSCTITRVINKEYSMTLTYTVPSTGPNKKEYFELWKFRARLYNIDDATDYQTFVMNQPEFRRGNNGAIEIVCVGEHVSIATMRNEIINAEIDFQRATKTQILTKILGYSTYTVGTVGASDRVSIKISYESVLSAIQKLIEVSGGEYTIDESAGTLSISNQIGLNNFVRIRSGKNIKSVSKKMINQNTVNKIYGVGGGSPPATIAGARHEIYSIVGQVITFTNNKVVPENDTWIGYKISVKTGSLTGSSFTITDSVHGTTNDYVTVSGTLTSLMNGDKVVITTSGDVEVDYIHASTSITTHGTLSDVYKNSKYGSIINFVKAADFDEVYTNGICDSWYEVGSAGTYLQNNDATRIKYGSKSQLISIISDNDSGLYQDVAIEQGKYYSVFANVYITSGVASFQITIGSTTYYVNNESGATGWQTLKFEGMYGTYDEITVSFKSFGTAEYYVDSVAVIESVMSENGSVEDRRFVKNCEQLDLWCETFDTLMTKKDPMVEYKANFIDLYKIDPENYAFDNIEIGDVVVLTDEELGISEVQARVTEMRYDPFRPETTEHTITTAV